MRKIQSLAILPVALAGIAVGVVGITTAGATEAPATDLKTTIPGSTQTNPMLVIGEVYAPGVYRSSGNVYDEEHLDACNFEARQLVSTTTGTETYIIQRNNNGWDYNGTVEVTVRAGDEFRSGHCSEWVRVGDVPAINPPTTQPTTPAPSAGGSLDNVFGS